MHLIVCMVVQEVTPNKNAGLEPLTSHLTNHPNKMNKAFGTLLDKVGQTHNVLWTLIHGHAYVGQTTKTYLDQLCVDIGYSL